MGEKEVETASRDNTFRVLLQINGVTVGGECGIQAVFLL